MTSPLLAEIEHKKSSRGVHYSLEVLINQDFIGKRYESTYRLRGKQAVYYLLPKALQELQNRYNYTAQVIKAMHRNQTASDSFIEHNLLVLKVYIMLQKAYPKMFNIFTKYELDSFDYFIRPLPDLYFHRINPATTLPNDYVLDIYTDTPTFVITKRVNAYIAHCELEDWQIETKSDYPAVILVCPNETVETKVQTYIAHKQAEGEIGNFTIQASGTQNVLTEKITQSM
jgi:hypothetical protein